MKVNVPIDLRLFKGTLKPLQTCVEGRYLFIKNVSYYDSLPRKIVSSNGLQ